MTLSRRELLLRLSVLVAGGAPLSGCLTSRSAQSPRNAAIRFGYAAITWGGRDEDAIDDIAALGFRGIQLRSNAVSKYADRPAALREILESRRLTLVALSSGNLELDPTREREQLDLHVRHARFLRDAGGLYLQIIDQRPRSRDVTASDYKKLGSLLTELGKRTTDIGVPISYHHHMGSVGERPEQIRAIMDATDPRFVKFQLDTAHYQQGGGDPVHAVREYADRLLFLHIKDLESPVAGDPNPRSYRFVELGRGRVDLPRVFNALADVRFNGWAIIELDSVTAPGRSAKESAGISKSYVQDVLGRSVQ